MTALPPTAFRVYLATCASRVRVWSGVVVGAIAPSCARAGGNWWPGGGIVGAHFMFVPKAWRWRYRCASCYTSGGTYAGSDELTVVQVLDGDGNPLVGKQVSSVYLVDGVTGARLPPSLAAVHVNGAARTIPAVLPSSTTGGFVGMPVVLSYVRNESDPRMSDVRVVVEVDGVASPASPKVVPSATAPDVGVCSRLVVLSAVGGGLRRDERD